eukprot:CAMPEP_0119108338 /NCGR_PEP_ID=MMETSP1180-20130426/13830_1 /TAXON_ID=3052 ORGANISM="Chlamydomonas cf sp, Strain CCMP681" /NCGR_SAMPLE_ID=MMETSP1180 /ASSEMBLY_ACC=CAM_ASM_000741 /LENGTH=45 /DNA_ID= /DNA_START= /DNA_END= /DNA_ORIENTATION=
MTSALMSHYGSTLVRTGSSRENQKVSRVMASCTSTMTHDIVASAN